MVAAVVMEERDRPKLPTVLSVLSEGLHSSPPLCLKSPRALHRQDLCLEHLDYPQSPHNSTTKATPSVKPGRQAGTRP